MNKEPSYSFCAAPLKVSVVDFVNGEVDATVTSATDLISILDNRKGNALLYTLVFLRFGEDKEPKWANRCCEKSASLLLREIKSHMIEI